MVTCLVRTRLGLLSVLGMTLLQGQEPARLSGAFSTAINTAYIGKIGTVFDDHPTLVNDLDVNIGSDWTAEVWSSTNVSGQPYNSTYGDELDLFLTWHHCFDDIRFSLTGACFMIVDLTRFENDLWIGEAEVSYSKWQFAQPYLCARHFGQVSDQSPERGWFGWGGVRGTYPTGVRQMGLTLDFSVADSDGALGKTPGLVYARAVVGLPIALGKCATLVPSILLQTPLAGQAEHPSPYTERNQVVGSLAIHITF